MNHSNKDDETEIEDDEPLRVCFRLRQKRPRSQEQTFLRDLEIVARSLGDPIWDHEGVGAHQEQPCTDPQILYGPRTAFVRYQGDTNLLRATLGSAPTVPSPVSCAGVEGPGKWTVSIMGAQNAAVISTNRNTNAHELFPRTINAPIIKAKARVIGEGLTDPSNLGSIFRLMGCFGLNELLHVHKDNHDPPLWDDVPLTSLIRTSAKGCEQHVERTFATISELCMYLAEEDRAPVVAIETAELAESMHTFKFPETCAIMVGSEGLGLRPAVVRALRPGFDSFVVIPMCGPHISLNVATALGCALYEYRRQWPLTP